MPFAHGRPVSGRARPGSARLPGPCRTATTLPATQPLRPFRSCGPPLSQPLRPRFPSLPHVAPAGVSGHSTEVLGSRHSPRPFPPSCAVPEPGPLRSTRITGLLHYYGPIRHPAGPSWPSRVPGWRVRATGRASPVADASLWPAGRRQCPGGADRCSRRSPPGRWQPSPRIGRVGLRLGIFEARPAFTRGTACALAEPSKTVLWHRSASIHVVASMNRSDCFRLERQLAGQDSHLLGGTAFPRCTAPRKLPPPSVFPLNCPRKPSNSSTRETLFADIETERVVESHHH